MGSPAFQSIMRPVGTIVREAMKLLRSMLGTDLHPVAYVVVREMPGDAWG